MFVVDADASVRSATGFQGDFSSRRYSCARTSLLAGLLSSSGLPLNDRRRIKAGAIQILFRYDEQLWVDDANENHYYKREHKLFEFSPQHLRTMIELNGAQEFVAGAWTYEHDIKCGNEMAACNCARQWLSSFACVLRLRKILCGNSVPRTPRHGLLRSERVRAVAQHFAFFGTKHLTT